MKKIYQIATVLAFIILIYIFQDWLRTFVITSLGGYTKQETKVTTETKYLKGKIDTLALFTEYIKTKGIILNPRPKIIYKYLPSNPGDTGISYLDSVKMFDIAVKDSVIDGNIQVINKFNGDLVEATFNYIPTAPKLLVRVDTIFKTTVIEKTLSKERAKFGIGTGYDWKMQNIQFLGSYMTKNGWQFIGEVEFAFTRQLINGIPQTSSNSVKIIKNF